MQPNRTTLIAALLSFIALPVLAQTVKVTPLGGVDGEFCPQDRALVFEDTNGTRVLYDPGRTVAGADDPRLGKIDIILVGHMHGDHVGNAQPTAVIASHANEVGTVMGKVRPGSKTEAFINAVKGPAVHIPLSGKTMEFDASGKCTAGC